MLVMSLMCYLIFDCSKDPIRLRNFPISWKSFESLRRHVISLTIPLSHARKNHQQNCLAIQKRIHKQIALCSAGLSIRPTRGGNEVWEQLLLQLDSRNQIRNVSLTDECLINIV